jgi:hypothetical protein
MKNILSLFPETYEESRERFRQNLAIVQKRWSDAALSHHHLLGDEDLTIDWIHSDALETNERVLVFTTGEHGVEGYVDSAMQQRLLKSFFRASIPGRQVCY